MSQFTLIPLYLLVGQYFALNSSWLGTLADWLSVAFTFLATFAAVCALLQSGKAAREAIEAARQSNEIARQANELEIPSLRAYIMPISATGVEYGNGSVLVTVKNFGPGVGTLRASFAEFTSNLSTWFCVRGSNGVPQIEQRNQLMVPGESFTFKVYYEAPESGDLTLKGNYEVLGNLWVCIEDGSRQNSRWIASRLGLRSGGVNDNQKPICTIEVKGTEEKPAGPPNCQVADSKDCGSR